MKPSAPSAPSPSSLRRPCPPRNPQPTIRNQPSSQPSRPPASLAPCPLFPTSPLH
jgi:hypothetical protein